MAQGNHRPQRREPSSDCLGQQECTNSLGDGDPGNRISTSRATTDGCLERPANRDHVSDRDICSGETYTALRPQSPLTLRGAGVRIHSGPGDSVSTKRPDIHTRPNSDQRNCLLDWRSPYTKLPSTNAKENRRAGPGNRDK